MKDLFEYYNEQPKALQKIASEMELEEMEQGGFDYPTLEAFKQRCEAIGYTFDYDLSAEPFDLRKFNPNDLTTQDFKKLYTMCGAWIRDNEKKDHRRNSVASIKELKQKVFNQFMHTL